MAREKGRLKSLFAAQAAVDFLRKFNCDHYKKVRSGLVQAYASTL